MSQDRWRRVAWTDTNKEEGQRLYASEEKVTDLFSAYKFNPSKKVTDLFFDVYIGYLEIT